MCSSTRCIRVEYSAWLAFLVKASGSGNLRSDRPGNWIAQGPPDGWLCPLRGKRFCMVALRARSWKEVHDFHAANARDPHGNKVAAVCRWTFGPALELTVDRS